MRVVAFIFSIILMCTMSFYSVTVDASTTESTTSAVKKRVQKKATQVKKKTNKKVKVAQKSKKRKYKATKQRYKVTYVTRNGKRVAIRTPIYKKYSVYRPRASRRLGILKARALERGKDPVNDPLLLSTGAVLAYDLENNKVLYEKNADEPMAIASITKLMTALVIVESKVNLDRKFLVTRADCVRSGARSKLRPGMKVSRRTALHLALMSSDNRAAQFLARTYPGGVRTFVRDMNTKAVLLNMTDTVFYDSTGLHNGNKSSAMDLSHLIASASEYRIIREYSTSPTMSLPYGRRTIVSRTTNRFVLDPDWDIDLQKTGLTTAAGYCMVMQTNISGRPVAMIFLDAPNKSARNSDIQKVRDWISESSVFQTAG
ncbi:MAG: serine hydrolase [Burkholderiaceae bacterium]|nr:serine hydrolase [Burkholderiaceae bacterium]